MQKAAMPLFKDLFKQVETKRRQPNDLSVDPLLVLVIASSLNFLSIIQAYQISIFRG